MRVAIVDDEAPARARLTRLLRQLPEVDVVGEAGDAHTALALIRAQGPDAVFLDIEMPGPSGMSLAHECRHLSVAPQIVFTTAHHEYAVEAFAVEAVDYLLKPVSQQGLLRAVERLRGPEPATAARQTLHATTGARTERLRVACISYFMAESKYVEAHHPEGVVLLNESLRALEEEFAAWFLRTHRKMLIRKDLIAALERDSLGRHQVRLRGREEVLPVSRRYLPGVRALVRGHSDY